MNLDQARGALLSLGEGLPAREGHVRLDASMPIAKITLDFPAARNALTVSMMGELAEAVSVLRNFAGVAVIVCANGPVFCSGGHLEDVQTALLEPGRGLAMARAMTAVLDALLELPCITVAAVNGPALGGGAEILTACDHRVLSRAASVRFVQAKLGIAPGWGGAHRLMRHVGRGTALRWLSTAATVSPDDALAAGFADSVVDGDAVAGAGAFLAPVLALPHDAIRAVKAQLVGARDDEASPFAAVWGSDVHRAALARR